MSLGDSEDGHAPYLLDVPLDAQGQVEQELEPLQHVEGVPGGIRLVLPAQHLLEERVRGVARPCLRRRQRNGVEG